MLTSYEQQTQRLLNDAANRFFNVGDLDVYINNARSDVAQQTQCLLANAVLSTVAGTQTYLMSSLAPPVGSGLLTPLNVRNLRSLNQGIYRRMEGRPWQWFSNYYLDGFNSVAQGSNPSVWTLQTQGLDGTIWLWPTPSGVASVIVDCTWFPIPLVDDSTVEALPPPWVSVVPYFAAYMALVQAQRLQDAQNLYGLYGKFTQSARLGVTPPWVSANYPTLTPLPSNIDVTASMAGATSKPAQRGEGSL